MTHKRAKKNLFLALYQLTGSTLATTSYIANIEEKNEFYKIIFININVRFFN